MGLLVVRRPASKEVGKLGGRGSGGGDWREGLGVDVTSCMSAWDLSVDVCGCGCRLWIWWGMVLVCVRLY